uniref:VWFA domain-containing protein n=1 Tax=Haemonchus contortus TaxID=6289 RepID=A0A7I4Y369_HAECO
MHMKRPEPWSLLVFLVGVSIGTVGTILAIVFGIESGKVQQCVCNGANVELFSVKTAIQPNFMSWDERFSNTSSPQYEAAVRNISKALTAALMPSGTNKALTLSSFSEGTMASVQVAQLRRGMNNLIISFAYGVVYGDETTASLPSYDDIQSQLDRDTSIVNSATVASVSSQNTNPCSYQQLTTSSPVTIHHSTPSGNTTSPLMTTIERTTPPYSTTKSQGGSSIFPPPPPSTSSTEHSTTQATQTSSTATVSQGSSTGYSKSRSTVTSNSSQSLPTTQPAASSTLLRSQSTSSLATESSEFTTTSHHSPSTKTTTISTQSLTSATVPGTSSRQSTLRPTTSRPQTTTFVPSRTTTSSTSSNSFSHISTFSPTPLSPSSYPTTTPGHSSSLLTSSPPSTSHPTTQKSLTTSPSVSTSTQTISTTQRTFTPVFTSSSTPLLPTSHLTTTTDRSSSWAATTSTYSSSSPSTTPSSSSSVIPTSSLTRTPSVPTNSTSSPAISASSTMLTTPTTTEPCLGERKYEGDLAIAFELTTNTNYADVESFVTTLLTYKGNPYSFSPDGSSQEAPSAYILVPYPNTIFYNPQNTYGKLRESDLNVSLSAFNVLLSLQPQTDATMNQAFDFIRSAKDGSNVRTVILVGVSDTFVQSAQQSAQGLVEEGYSIFTVSIGVANFSSLATNKSFVYELVSPSSSVEASLIASEIGTTLLQKSSTCVYAPQSTTVTPTPSSRTTDNHVYSSTTSPCKTPFIQQDIAFVVEISTSTGNLGASHAASNFITNYLIQQKVFDDVYSNFAIVPFPNASSYILGGGIQDFGQLLVEDFVPAFQMIFAVYPITNGAVSDIESGLRYTNDSEFPRLHDDYPRTILLFANSDDGVEAALKISSELKAQTVNILTVSMSDTDDINLQALSSAPDYNWNLPVSDASSYLSMAEVISSKLLELGSVCNDHG